MDKGNTLYYHGHILSSIDKLDMRKDSYIGHRLDFLSAHCKPIQHRINGIKEDIKYYENMRDTQYEVIQAEPDIMHLKKQIKEYTKTKAYYDRKLDQYDMAVSQLEGRNAMLKRALQLKREQYKLTNGGALKKALNQTSPVQQKTLKRDKSILGSTIGIEEDIEEDLIVRDGSLENIGKLPKIKIPHRPVSKYYIFNQSRIQEQHYRSQRGNKTLNQSLSQALVSQDNPEHSGELKVTDLKAIISKFDKTESLFRQCFERKKIAIQKSVSQLQSHLITNKDIFLKACQVIGQKQGKLSLEEFTQLSSDEIVTLFISFSWLNRKVYGEFVKKRKDIIALLRKIKQAEAIASQ